MPFNERITNHRRLMRAAMRRLDVIEENERLLKHNKELLMERRVRLIDEYGQLMTELIFAVTSDACMPKYEPPNMVELAEQYYNKKSLVLDVDNKGAIVRRSL